VLAGQPRKQEYHTSVRAAYDIITTQGIAASFPACMWKHCRGLFAAINVGLTYGKGCSFPSWINNKQYDPIAQCLLADPHINQMANFASGVFLPAFCSTFTDLILEQGRSLPGHHAFTNTMMSTTENYTRSTLNCAALLWARFSPARRSTLAPTFGPSNIGMFLTWLLGGAPSRPSATSTPRKEGTWSFGT
jgi:hypothetical protein